MMNSTTRNNLKKAVKILLSLLFWVSVWEIFALLTNNNFLLPSVPTTANELIIILKDISSYRVMLFTLLRVGCGLCIGIFSGIILGILCHKSSLLNTLVSPALLVMKSTPVASFIILLWIIMSGDALSVFIAVLMVTPIVYQNVIDAYSSVDVNLSEVCDVFKFSKFKRFNLLIRPTLTAFLIPATITSAGLAWKAEIAAEIIAYTKNSIGQHINDAKFEMNMPRVFAWTIIVIVFSLLLEKTTKNIVWRLKNGNHNKKPHKTI